MIIALATASWVNLISTRKTLFVFALFQNKNYTDLDPKQEVKGHLITFIWSFAHLVIGLLVICSVGHLDICSCRNWSFGHWILGGNRGKILGGNLGQSKGKSNGRQQGQSLGADRPRATHRSAFLKARVRTPSGAEHLFGEQWSHFLAQNQNCELNPAEKCHAKFQKIRILD